MAHPAKEVGLHLACAVRTLESLLKGLLLTRLILDRVVDVHEHAHARAGNALLVAPELRGGANPHAPAVLTPHAVVDIVRTALRCGDAELVVDTGKVVRGDEPVRASAVAGQTFLGFVAKDAAALVGEPKPCGIALLIEVGVQQAACKRSRASTASCSKARSARARCLRLISSFALASALCAGRSSSMSSCSRSAGSVTSAKSKREGTILCLELIFDLVCMIPRLLHHQPTCMG